MKNGYLLEDKTVKLGYQGDFQANQAGARVSLKGADKVTILIMAGVGVATADLELTLSQHDAITAGNTKALTINNTYFYKTNAQDVFTKVKNQVPETEFSSVVVPALATAAGILAVDVNAEDLDVNNAFFAVSATLKAAGAARTATMLYVVGGLAYGPAYKHSI